jgi:gas vesicle structural protein
MTVAAATSTGSGYLSRPGGGSLAEVIDIILDKGLVIDAYVRVSLIGIEILTIDARIVIASVDTYLRFAEAVNRLDLREAGDSQGLPELLESVTSRGARSKTRASSRAPRRPSAAATTRGRGAARVDALPKPARRVRQAPSSPAPRATTRKPIASRRSMAAGASR